MYFKHKLHIFIIYMYMYEYQMLFEQVSNSSA